MLIELFALLMLKVLSSSCVLDINPLFQAGGVTQVVEHPPSNYEVLSLNPSTPKQTNHPNNPVMNSWQTFSCIL
jgi:hypothetical protein